MVLSYQTMELIIIYYFFLFVLIVTFCFTIPGFFIILKSNTLASFWEKIVLGTALGFVLFTLLTYFQIMLKIPFLSLAVIIFINLFALNYFRKYKEKIHFFSKTQLSMIFVVLVFGVIGQMAIIAPSGLKIGGELIFWSSHAHDGMWHIALMNELQKGYPIQNPLIAGERLVNYHYFSDLAPAFFNYYFNLSKLDLYFRFFPLLFSLLLGSLSFIIGEKIGKSFYAGLWSMIFLYFAGSFGYIVTYLQSQTIGGEALFWSTQIQSTTGNPPQAAALIIFLTFAIFLMQLLKGKNFILSIICILLAGSLIVFKVYAAFVVFGALSLVALFRLFKKDFQPIIVFISSLILSLILYLPNASNSTSFLIFEPWWYVRTMVVANDKLNWLDLELRRQTYIAEDNWKRVIQLELTAFLIFLFGNLGMRFIGFFSLFKTSLQMFRDPFSLYLILATVISFTFPLLFLQKGVASNTSQFFQYFLLIMGIFAGVSTAQLMILIKPRFLKVVIAATIIALSVPTQLSLIINFYSYPAHAKITQNEIEALAFIQKHAQNSIVLSQPYQQYFDQKKDIPIIWDWFDTSYIAALSQQKSFVADYEQLDIMGYNYKPRILLQEQIFQENDPETFVNLVQQTNADLLYFPKILKPQVDLLKTPFNKKFENKEIEIWGVN